MAENLGKAVLTLSTDSTKLNKGLDSAQKRTAKLKKAFKVGGLAALGMGVAFAKLAKDAIDSADNFAKMSKKVGISVESLSALDFAAKISGTSLDSMKIGLTRLAANASDASMGIGEAKDAFNALQISTTGAAGEIKPMETLLLEVADKFEQMEDGTEKTAVAMKIFGKSGTDLIPMLNAGSAGIQEMKDRAEELGIVISTKTAEQSERFNDALVELSSAFQGIIFSILDSGLLDALVDLSEMLADASANSTDFSLAGEALAFGLKAIQLAVLSAQLAFNGLVLGLLEGFQAVNKLMGSWSPFKDLTEGLTAATDLYNEKLLTGAERIDKVWKGTKKLTEAQKKAKAAAKKQSEELKKLADAARKSAAKQKVLTDEIKDYVTQAKKAISPTDNVTKHYKWLKDAGLDLKEIMIVMGAEIDTVTTAFDDLGKELPDDIQALKDLQLAASPITQLMKDSKVEIDFTTGSIIALTSKTNLAITAEDAHNAALKRLAGTDGGVAKAETALDDLGVTIDNVKGTDALSGIKGLGSEFSSFLGGIDSNIIPGIGKIKTAFDSVMGTVNGFIDTFDTILGFFGQDGLGGIDLGNLFGGGEGGGLFGGGGGGSITTPTASFTELGITGVAIQTGIFGTGVGITGVQIQKGEFHTGVSLTGVSFKLGGGGDTKETAFNTRHILAVMNDWFPEFQKVSIAGVEATQTAGNHLINLTWWAEFQGGKLANISTRMDELIPIQRDRIAPAIESIDRKTPIEINNVINVTVSGGGSGAGGSAAGPFPPMASKVGKQIGDQIIKTVKDGIATNKLGLRAALKKI